MPDLLADLHMFIFGSLCIMTIDVLFRKLYNKLISYAA